MRIIERFFQVLLVLAIAATICLLWETRGLPQPGMGLLANGAPPLSPYAFNVPGVTWPQNYWNFLSGTYNNYGTTASAGNLTPQGTGNSFGAGGLILNGSGYADCPNNPDVCDLGVVYSVLIEFSASLSSSWQGFIDGGSAGSANGWNIACPGPSWWFGTDIFFETGGHGTGTGTTLSPNLPYQVIIVSTGANGNPLVYLNGLFSYQSAQSWPLMVAGTSPFQIGVVSGLSLWIGTAKRVAVLKGTAWSSSDAAAIWSTLAQNGVKKFIEICKAPFRALYGPMIGSGPLFNG